MWISSADPDADPSIDDRYFTDAAGHDERMLVAGVRAARRIAEEEPMRSHVVREIFPTVTAVNPVVTIMTVAERAAELILRG